MGMGEAPGPLVDINRRFAKLGIKTAMVFIETSGQIKQKANVTGNIPQG